MSAIPGRSRDPLQVVWGDTHVAVKGQSAAIWSGQRGSAPRPCGQDDLPQYGAPLPRQGAGFGLVLLLRPWWIRAIRARPVDRLL